MVRDSANDLTARPALLQYTDPGPVPSAIRVDWREEALMRNRLLSAVVPLMLGVSLILPTARPARLALAQQMPAAGQTDHQDHSDHTGQLGSVQFATTCSPAVEADF